MKKCLYILGLIAVVSVTNIATTFAAEETSQKSVASTALVQTFEQTRPLSFWWNNFALQADSGALMHNLELSFELLREDQLHRMPSYMVNVTGDNAGAYRLLPNGIHFSKPATIAIPYDDILLPMGYKPKDIKTYYFDENLA